MKKLLEWLKSNCGWLVAVLVAFDIGWVAGSFGMAAYIVSLF